MPQQDEPIIVVRYDPAWPLEFRRIAKGIRGRLGPTALRIDHVGSTSVVGLDAKPIIDVQVSVGRLDPLNAFRRPLEQIGYRFQGANPDLSKRFFLGPTDQRRTHVHVRVAGCFDEQFNLLFRDFLRSHPTEAAEYAREKWRLAEQHRNDREGYVRAKEPTIWRLTRSAHDWLQTAAWSAGPSDA